MTLQQIPLDNLSPAKTNVRRRGGKNIADLLSRMRAHGLLQPLLVRPKDGSFEIVAGQRRYHALCALTEEQDTAEDVPCLVMGLGDDADVIEASLAENITRLPMDEIVQYTAFSALVKKGREVSEIATHFGVTEPLVTQRLAIANLISPILSAYRKGDIRADTLRTLTLASKSQQRDWWTLVKDEESYAPTGRNLKAWLFGGADIPTRNALFDLEDYDGAIISDLFGEDSYFADSTTFWEHQNRALARAKEAYRDDGWADVVIYEVGAYFVHYEHHSTSKKEGGQVYVEVAHNGAVTFHEGFLTRKDAEARARQASNEPAPRKPECTQAMQNYLGLHKHAAVRHGVLGQNGLIQRLIAAQMMAGTTLWRCQIDPQKAAKDSIAESLQQNPSQAAFEKENRQSWQSSKLHMRRLKIRVPRRTACSIFLPQAMPLPPCAN